MIQRPGELTQWVGDLHVLHLDRPFGRLLKVTNQMRQYDKKIIECKFVVNLIFLRDPNPQTPNPQT